MIGRPILAIGVAAALIMTGAARAGDETPQTRAAYAAYEDVLANGSGAMILAVRMGMLGEAIVECPDFLSRNIESLYFAARSDIAALPPGSESKTQIGVERFRAEVVLHGLTSTCGADDDFAKAWLDAISEHGRKGQPRP